MENIINNIFSFFNNLIIKPAVGKDQSPTGRDRMTFVSDVQVYYDFTESEEGRELEVYKCTGNALTIGVGHNIDANGLPPHITEYFAEHNKITNEMADELLRIDVANSIKTCHKIYGEQFFESLSLPRRTALVSFAFQLGEYRLKKFKNTNEHIKKMNWKAVANHLRVSLIYKQTPKRIKRMINILLEDKF